MGIPVYVGCSIDVVGLGLVAEEEMEGFRKIVEAVVEQWEQRRRNSNNDGAVMNGHS